MVTQRSRHKFSSHLVWSSNIYIQMDSEHVPTRMLGFINKVLVKNRKVQCSTSNTLDNDIKGHTSNVLTMTSKDIHLMCLVTPNKISHNILFMLLFKVVITKLAPPPPAVEHKIVLRDKQGGGRERHSHTHRKKGIHTVHSLRERSDIPSFMTVRAKALLSVTIFDSSGKCHPYHSLALMM